MAVIVIYPVVDREDGGSLYLRNVTINVDMNTFRDHFSSFFIYLQTVAVDVWRPL
jgi:hypothetical protein